MSGTVSVGPTAKATAKLGDAQDMSTPTRGQQPKYFFDVPAVDGGTSSQHSPNPTAACTMSMVMTTAIMKRSKPLVNPTMK